MVMQRGWTEETMKVNKTHRLTLAQGSMSTVISSVVCACSTVWKTVLSSMVVSKLLYIFFLFLFKDAVIYSWSCIKFSCVLLTGNCGEVKWGSCCIFLVVISGMGSLVQTGFGLYFTDYEEDNTSVICNTCSTSHWGEEEKLWPYQILINLLYACIFEPLYVGNTSTIHFKTYNIGQVCASVCSLWKQNQLKKLAIDSLYVANPIICFYCKLKHTARLLWLPEVVYICKV